MEKFNPKARHRARKIAVQALYQWDMTGQDLSEIESQFFSMNDLDKIDVPYFQNLFNKIPAMLTELDETLAPLLLNREAEELGKIERAILRLSTYELAHRPEVPYKVVINEGVELAKIFGANDSHKFINGVLDKLAPKLRPHE